MDPVWRGEVSVPSPLGLPFPTLLAMGDAKQGKWSLFQFGLASDKQEEHFCKQCCQKPRALMRRQVHREIHKAQRTPASDTRMVAEPWQQKTVRLEESWFKDALEVRLRKTG